MPKRSSEIMQDRARVIANARKLVDLAETEKRSMTAEESTQFDTMMADADRMRTEAEQVSRRELVETAEADLNISAGRRVRGDAGNFNTPTASEYRESFRAWCLAGTDVARHDPETRTRAANCGIVLNSRSVSLRALSVGTNTAGGHTVPTSFQAQIEKKLAYYAKIRNVAAALRTDAGNNYDYPRVSDTANVATIVGEAGAIGSATDPTFDKVTMLAWKYATPIVKLSVELLQDSAVNLEELLGELFGDRMGRGQAAHFMTGDGTTQPEGMATNATVAVNLATGNAITIDKVLELIHALDIAYREGAIFIMNDATALALRKLKDSDGQYLWQPSVQAGQADTLLGYPVFIHNSLTSIATPGDNQKLIVFGNPKHYLVRDVASSMQVTRLDELYAASGQVGFVMLMRTDGRVIGHSGSFVTLNSYDAP